jgi:acetyltransferase-like isoleucine patch superfamily enzyme
MTRKLLQFLAFFLPSPFNILLHRAAGARIGRRVMIHPGVLILARRFEAGDDARIKFGTMMSLRTLKLGRKTSIGFFVLAKGDSDLLMGDACIIGPRCNVNCDREVVMDYYSGVGPGTFLYTHGSGMPVTEGYRATFGPIHLETKAWVTMRCVIGPGVTVGKGTCVMPGTVLVESVPGGRLVAGNPAKLINMPLVLVPRKPGFLEEIAERAIRDYHAWAMEYHEARWTLTEGTLLIPYRGKSFSISLKGDPDILLLTHAGERRAGHFFNLDDLKTDEGQHPLKSDLEAFLRLYFGLIFL